MKTRLSQEQPPHSPDMTPTDFFLYTKLKLLRRYTSFQPIEDIKKNSRQELKLIRENSFKKCFENWINRCNKCIISKAVYFEDDTRIIPGVFLTLYNINT